MGNTPFCLDSLEIDLEDGIFLPAGDLNRIRRDATERLSFKILSRYRRDGAVPDSGLPWQGGAAEGANPRREGVARDSGPRLRVLTETREQFLFAIRQPEVERVYLEEASIPEKDFGPRLAGYLKLAHEAGKECWLALPYVFRMGTAAWHLSRWDSLSGADGFLARNYDSLGFLKERGVDPGKVQGDYGLYAYSSAALGMIGSISLGRAAVPVELNAGELRKYDCTNSEMQLYGRQPLMVSAQCLRKNTGACDRAEGVLWLQDRYGKRFPVRNRCRDCYNVIYNSSPLSLFGHYREACACRPDGVRISFTTEGGEEMETVFALYREAAGDGETACGSAIRDYTNGHWKRGVE